MRKPRIQFQGALYHVIARGNQRQKVFLSPADHLHYLDILGRKTTAFSIKIYSYCLMPNHVHLLLEQSGHPPLSKCMQGLQTAYTKYFNKTHRKSGHLFQDRYKALLVERDIYLLELVRYIHLNPFRAKLEEKIGLYPWTRHAQYLGKADGSAARISRTEVLAMLSKTNSVKAFLRFIREGTKDGHRGDFYETSRWQVLGSEGYEARSLARVGERPERTLKLNMGIGKIWNLLKGRERMLEEPKGHARARLMENAAWLAVECGGERQVEVAKYFSLSQSGVSAGLIRLNRRWEENPGERKSLLDWAKKIKN